MNVVFCQDPLQPHLVDAAYRAEAHAFAQQGFSIALVDHDLIEAQDWGRALKHLPPGTGLYRGWMLSAPRYAHLHEQMQARGLELLQTPHMYALCHHMPQQYPFFQDVMPKTIDIPIQADLARALSPFGSAPIVVKDWVKSQSGYWEEACYIPNAQDTPHAQAVVDRFLALQGSSFCGGLVFRAYHPLQRVQGQVVEWRSFFFQGRFLGVWPRGPFETPPPLAQMLTLGARVPATFFSLDMVLTEAGDWMLIEIGDGGVSGVPPGAMAEFVASFSSDRGA